MKIFNVAILLCLMAGSQASFLDSLKDRFTNLGQGLLEAGKTVGNSLLDQLKQTGMTLASTAVGELVDQLDQVAASGGSKRDLSAILHEAGPVMQLLEKTVGDHSEAQKVVFALAMKEFEHVVQNMTSADPASLLKTFKMIDDIVEGHAKLADYLLTDLKSSVTSLVPHKRSLVDSLGQVGNSLTDMFSPQIDSLKSIISSVGDALKQAAAGLFSSLIQSVAQLGSQLAPQLSTHVDAVKQSGTAIAGEGQNALDSLTSAVGDIFHQTMTNIQPHLSNIVEHGKQALGQAAGQIMTNMLTHSLTSALTGHSE